MTMQAQSPDIPPIHTRILSAAGKLLLLLLLLLRPLLLLAAVLQIRRPTFK
jgi:hypothetical protein